MSRPLGYIRHGNPELSHEQISNQKQNVSWPFGEPTHKPRKPIVSVRNQNTAPVPLFRELQLQRSLNPIEHLKFKVLWFQSFGGSPSCHSVDQVSVVGSKGSPHAVSTSLLPQQLLREPKIAFVDLALLQKSDSSRFVVSALHQSNSSASWN